MVKKAYIQCDGQALYYEFALNTLDDVPTLFVAKNEKDELFLCLCSEMRGLMRWVIGKTDAPVLNGLIGQHLTINEALSRTDPNVRIVEHRKGVGFTCEKVPIREVNPLYLTEEGLYADFLEEDAEEKVRLLTIQWLSNELKQQYEEHYHAQTDDSVNKALYEETKRQSKIPDYQENSEIKKDHNLSGLTFAA